MAEVEETTRENLLKSMKRTKGVRFNASKRLEKSERTKTALIAYASVSVIVLTILPAFFKMPLFVVAILGLLTVGMSVVILVATLIQNSDAGLVKSDQFHRCALEVNALRRELLASGNDGPDLAGYVARYNEIMQRYGLNHDPVDYEQYKLDHVDEFPEVATRAADEQSVPENTADRRAALTLRLIVIITILATVSSVIPALLIAAAQTNDTVKHLMELDIKPPSAP